MSILTLLLVATTEPLRPDAVLSFARQAESQQDFEQAGLEFYRFASYWPGDSLAAYALFRAGLCYARAGRFKVAQEIFLKYQESGYPKPEFAALERARIGITLSQDQAWALLDSLEHVLPNDVAITRAWFALTQDKPELAQRLMPDSMKQLIQGFPSGPSPWIAGIMSAVVPGTGQLYYKHPGDGFMAFLFSVGFAGISYYYFAKENRVLPASITAGFAAFFWLGQSYGACVGARAHRHHLRQNYLLELKPRLFKDRYGEDFFR